MKCAWSVAIPSRFFRSEAQQRHNAATVRLYLVRRDLLHRAVQGGLDPKEFRGWLEWQSEPFLTEFHAAVQEADQRFPEVASTPPAADLEAYLTACADAIERLADRFESLAVPEGLPGRVNRRYLTDSDLPALLDKYETVTAKAAKAARGKVLKFRALWEAFPDVPPGLSDPRGQFFAEKFAKQVLAREYDCEVPTIVRALTRARKTRR